MNGKFKCSWNDFKKVLETTDIMTEVCRGEVSSNGESRRNEGATPSPSSPVIPWLKDWEKER